MGLTDTLPGMRSGSGHRLRNSLVALGYGILILAIIGNIGDATTDDTPEPESADSADAEAATAQANESGGANESGDAGAGDGADDAGQDAGGDEGDESDDAPTDTDAPETESESEADSEAIDEGEGDSPTLTAESFASILEGNDFTVVTTHETDDTMVIDIQTDADSEEALTAEFERIAFLYAQNAPEGVELQLTAYDANMEMIGDSTVEAGWASQFQDDEMSREELNDAVSERSYFYF